MEHSNYEPPHSEYTYSTKSGYTKINKKKIELDHVKSDCSLLAFLILLLLFLQSALPYVLSSALLRIAPSRVNDAGVPLNVNWQILTQGAVYFFSMGITLLAAKYSVGYRVGMLRLKAAPLGDWTMQLFAVLGTGIVGSFVGGLFNNLCSNIGLNYRSDRVVCSSWSNLLLLLLVYVVLPAVMEEMLFREMIYRYFGKYGVSFAVLVSSFGFAAIHFQPGEMINAFLVGLVLTYARIYSGSVLPCVGLHGAYNLFALFVLLVRQQYQLPSPWLYALFLVVLCIAVASVIGLNLRANLNTTEDEQDSTFFEKVTAAVTNSGFWIMVALLIYAMVEQGR